MISKAKNVTDYLDEVPEGRKAALKQLRASQKNHICFYCLVHGVMLDNAALLIGLNHGKGVIRFSNPGKIDFEVIRRILEETVKSGEKPC